MNLNHNEKNLERNVSIHDIHSAPEAPDSSLLMNGFSSPGAGSPRAGGESPLSPRKQLKFISSSMLRVPDLSYDSEASNRPRSETAPGRMSNISELETGISYDASPSANTMMQLTRKRTQSENWNDIDEDGAEDYLGDSLHGTLSRREASIGQSPGPIPAPRAIRCCGIPLPCLTTDAGARASAVLVRYAPCFWCYGEFLHLGATDRAIMYRLNLLCAFFAFFQMGPAIFLMITLSSNMIVDRSNNAVSRDQNAMSWNLNLWNLNGNIICIGLLGAVVFVTALLTLKVVREVNLRGSVRYLWVLLWVLPVQIFFVISLIDYHRVTKVFIRHWWQTKSMAWFCKVFCPGSTGNTLCIVPINGGIDFPSEVEWCEHYYDATNCTEIRDAAQSDTTRYAFLFYSGTAVWGALLVVLLLLTINILEGVITRPIVQSAKESIAPIWLLLPIVGSFSVGAIFLFAKSSAIKGTKNANKNVWVGVLYIISGLLFFMSALFGWFLSMYSILNARDKRNKTVAVLLFLGINLVTTALMAALFAGSVLLSLDLVKVGLTDSERGRLACGIDTAGSCTLCSNRVGLEECPEFTAGEVVQVLQAQFKSSAALSVIFVLYCIGSLRFGMVLKKSIAMYQIDYV